jgi:hypothetical protein
MNEPLRYLAQVANAAKQSYRIAIAGGISRPHFKLRTKVQHIIDNNELD